MFGYAIAILAVVAFHFWAYKELNRRTDNGNGGGD